MFDNQVYGVAHGLLMGYRETVWVQAQSLFDEVRQMDTATASAFYNALTDMLWHFGQVRRMALSLRYVICLVKKFIMSFLDSIIILRLSFFRDMVPNWLYLKANVAKCGTMSGRILA